MSPSPTPETTTEIPQATTSTEDVSLLNKEEPAAVPEAPKAPDAYDLKAPEGQTLDPELLAEAAPILKELGLSNEGAQKLVDLFNKQSAVIVDKLYNQQREVRAGWAKEAETSLTSLPGGAKQARQDIQAAKAAVFADASGTPDAAKIAQFNQFMDMTGAGDNPAFVEAFVKMAQKFVEGKPIQGGGPSAFGQKAPDSGPKSRAAAIYPNLSGN